MRRWADFDQTALALAAVVFGCHLAGNPHYGFFRDELYFIVCGRHPAFGYVDQPPVVPLLAAGSQVFGTSLVALRAVPAALAAAAAYVACVLAGDMGGGRFAKVLAGLATALAPVLAAFGTFLGPDSAQTPLWPLAILFVGRALMRRPEWWLAAGGAFGVAGEAKYSTVIAAAALLAGVAVTRHRRAFVSLWFWGGIAVCGAMLAPNAWWQWAHGLPMLELLRNGQHGKNVVLSPVVFVLQQFLLTNPPVAILWVAGVAWCFSNGQWRWLGAGFVVLLGLMAAMHGKSYYPAAIYPALFAAGGVAAERLLGGNRLARWGAYAWVGVPGVALLPVVMPVLPEETMASYLGALQTVGIGAPETENHRRAVLGQSFSDMHGWPELAATVSRLYGTLPAEDRKRAAIFAANYGEAAAIDVLAQSGALPPAISGHNQYWLWGPRNWDGAVVIDVNGDFEADKALCASAEVIATFSAQYVMPYETDYPIVLCRGLKMSPAAMWAAQKRYE